jgi:hypothetical protein
MAKPHCAAGPDITPIIPSVSSHAAVADSGMLATPHTATVAASNFTLRCSLIISSLLDYNNRFLEPALSSFFNLAWAKFDVNETFHR